MKTNYTYLLSVLIPQQLLYTITVLFAVVILLVSIIIIIYLFRKNRLDSHREQIKNDIGNLIGEIAICETDEELEEAYAQPEFKHTIEKYKQHSFDKKVLIRELAETCKKLSGSSEKNLQWLFGKTGLKSELLDQLKNKRWFIKSLAIQQMAALNQTDYLRKIYYYTNHENKLVRMDAQVAIVKLTGFKGLRFLNIISQPITIWQQLQLLNELSRQTPDDFENLSKWLASSNDSVVEFSLRLAGIYQRYEQYENVVDCLSHPSKHIAEQAIETLSKIHLEDTASILVSRFHSLDKTCQLMILKILKDIGSQNEIAFLKSILNHPDDDSFKLEAARAIKFINSADPVLSHVSVHGDSYPWNIILSQLNKETA
jgi:hypothetical protein